MVGVSRKISSLSDLPAPLAEVLALSVRLEAECIVFDPNDHVVYASQTARTRYPFIDFTMATFKGIYWGVIRNNLVSISDLKISPHDYLIMAQNSRIANNNAHFVKRYLNQDLLCHHRAAEGWSIQSRLPIDDLRFAGVRPSTLAEAGTLIDHSGRQRFALERLATGIVYLMADGSIAWANASGANLLPAIPKSHVKAAIDTALSAPGQRHLLALPSPDGQPVLTTVEAFTGREVLMLIAPRMELRQLAPLLKDAAGLTPVQADIATLIAAGFDTHAVAVAAKKERGTIRFQLSRIFQRISPLVNTSQTGLTHLVSRLAALAGPPRRLH